MAKTFIGELILKLQDQASGKAKEVANNLTGSIHKIEAAAKAFNATSWGGRFETQLQKLGAGAQDIEKLRASWNRLNDDIKRRNLGKSLGNAELANFKVAALNNFAGVRNGWNEHAKAMEKRTRNMANNMKEALKPIMVALGGYTGAYMAGVAGREGVIASAAWEREKFRGRMANIPKEEQNQLLNASEKLGSQYPSINITEIAEMARNARAMMGTSDRAIAILPDIVRGLVTLQSVKGTDAAGNQMISLLKGIDNAGKNNDGQIGINDTKAIIAGIMRAAQTDSDVDPGRLFQFARRGKIAVPGLSTDFLANTAPAFMQDMTPEGFGTALSSAYQALVVGSTAVSSKQNIAYQKQIGIRGDKGLVDAELYGLDPYAWVKKNLIPALKKQGVDMNNETDVAQEVAKISRNTNATGLLTRMITQQQQVDRAIEQYKNSMGPEAADQARFNDPFIAYKGFIESLRNLAAAVGEDTMPSITSGLNTLADGINRFQQLWRDGDPATKAGAAAGALGAGYAAYKGVSMVWGLITAGASLNAAAASLEAAAVSLGAGGKVPGLPDSKKGGWFGGWGTKLAALAPVLSTLLLSGDNSNDAFPNDTPSERAKRYNRRQAKMQAEYDALHPKLPLNSGPHPRNPRAADSENPAEVIQRWSSAMDAIDKQSANPTIKVEDSSLDSALAKAKELAGVLAQISGFKGPTLNGPVAGAPNRGNVQREMGRNFADHGVAGLGPR